MFGTVREDVHEMLLDRRILPVLQKANSLRNSYAHGGVSAPREIEMVNEQLTDLVQVCRSAMGSVWENYELIQPMECRFRGGLFEYTVRLLMGTRTPLSRRTKRPFQEWKTDSYI